VSTQTPEALLREYADHYNLMPEDVDYALSLLRQAERAAALAMRDRAARAVDDYDIDFRTPGCCRVAAERTAERLADAVRSLEV
jgi:hypothetical protein